MIITLSLLASLTLASFSFVHPSYARTFQDKGVVGFVYPDWQHLHSSGAWLGAIPLYRWQNWDTGAYLFTIADLYNPDPSVSPAQRQHLTLPTVAGYLAWPGTYTTTDGITTSTVKTVHLHTYFNWATKEHAFSNVPNDPRLKAEGFDWTFWIGDVFPKKVMLCNPSCVSTAPLHDYLIDGKHHFYSIHPTEVEDLGHRKIP